MNITNYKQYIYIKDCSIRNINYCIDKWNDENNYIRRCYDHNWHGSILDYHRRLIQNSNSWWSKKSIIQLAKENIFKYLYFYKNKYYFVMEELKYRPNSQYIKYIVENFN